MLSAAGHESWSVSSCSLAGNGAPWLSWHCREWRGRYALMRSSGKPPLSRLEFLSCSMNSASTVYEALRFARHSSGKPKLCPNGMSPSMPVQLLALSFIPCCHQKASEIHSSALAHLNVSACVSCSSQAINTWCKPLHVSCLVVCDVYAALRAPARSWARERHLCKLYSRTLPKCLETQSVATSPITQDRSRPVRQAMPTKPAFATVLTTSSRTSKAPFSWRTWEAELQQPGQHKQF